MAHAVTYPLYTSTETQASKCRTPASSSNVQEEIVIRGHGRGFQSSDVGHGSASSRLVPQHEPTGSD